MVYTEDVLRTASGKRVLVIGDVMLDQYIYGQIERLSPETGVPVILEKSREQMLGGAANVAVNIAALGGHCHLIGVTGNDAAASIMSILLTSWPGIDADLVKEPSRQTTTKTRFLNKRTEAHLFRLDQECTDTPPREVCEDIAERALKALHRTNVVVLSDYCKGVLTSDLIMRVIDAATSLQIPIVVDPKRKDFQLYSGATVIAPNLNELSSAIGRALPQDDIEIGQAASSLLSDISVTGMCVKRSEAGLQLVCASGSTAKFAATSRNVIDVAGAGDTVVACLALSMACGTDLETAAFLPNAAAGIAVAKEGVASVSYDELMATLKYPKSNSKIFWAHNICPLLQQILRWKSDGRKVGFTNGCFDLLHAGHISSFDEAREQVDHLVVAINSDDSVKRLKGPMRPIQDENTRAVVVAALQAVDAVIIFDEDTPLEIIAQLQPCAIFKGGDYKAKDVVGHDLVSSYGGRVIITDHRSGISTTETIRRAQETHCGPSSSITRPKIHGMTLFEYNATNSAALSLQSAHKLRKEISELYTWLKETAWPYWQEYGLARKTDGVPFGFNEYLGGSEGAILSDQQRLLVVARQTYVFSEALAAGISKAEEPVLLGLRLLRSHARNEESGFYDSFFLLHGSTQNLDDEPKSLYDHAFVLLALASAMKVLPNEEIREDALSLDQCIQTNFHGTRMGFHDTLPPTESRRQNPLMHLLEAYLAAFEAFRSDVYLSRADDLMNLFLKHLWDPMIGAVPEQLDDCMHAELVEGRYVVEPGHLAEWVRLVHWYKNINVSLGRPLGWKEDLTIKGMIKFYETHGRHSTTRALVDEVWSDGEHCRESQRLWPQTERLQAELLRQDMSESGISEAMNVLKDYIDAGQSGLWAEFRSSCGSFDPGSCKASSMYHLTCAITTAWKVFQPLEDSGKSPERTADYAKLSNTVTVRPNDEPHCEVSPRTRYDSPILTPTRDADEAATDDETKSVNTGVEDFVKPMVVVTGGAGFIGSNVVAALNESNKYDVVVSDYLGSDDKWLNLRKRTIRDLIPPGELMAWLKDRNDIQAIIHMGANSSTQARDGDEVMESNFRTSLRLLDWCTERQVKFIYASSAATYGNGDQGFDDDMSLDYLKTLRPLNLYGWSKHLFDKEVAQRRESGMALPPVCIGLKFFNVYGPNEYHKSAMASLVTKYFPSIQAGKSVDLFRSYRDEYADGGQLRDFVYVHDVTDAVLWLLDHASPGVAMYNIGSARASSFVELVTASFTAMGLPPQINFVDMPAALRSSYQYYTKAEDVRLREIGYNLPWSTVQEAVTHFVETYLATEDAYR